VNSEKLQVRHTSVIESREQPLPRFQPLHVLGLLDPVLKGCHCSTSLQENELPAEILPSAQQFFNFR
jgi:hypothetical protein